MPTDIIRELKSGDTCVKNLGCLPISFHQSESGVSCAGAAEAALTLFARVVRHVSMGDATSLTTQPRGAAGVNWTPVFPERFLSFRSWFSFGVDQSEIFPWGLATAWRVRFTCGMSLGKPRCVCLSIEQTHFLCLTWRDGLYDVCDVGRVRFKRWMRVGAFGGQIEHAE